MTRKRRLQNTAGSAESQPKPQRGKKSKLPEREKGTCGQTGEQQPAPTDTDGDLSGPGLRGQTAQDPGFKPVFGMQRREGADSTTPPQPGGVPPETEDCTKQPGAGGGEGEESTVGGAIEAASDRGARGGSTVTVGPTTVGSPRGGAAMEDATVAGQEGEGMSVAGTTVTVQIETRRPGGGAGPVGGGPAHRLPNPCVVLDRSWDWGILEEGDDDERGRGRAGERQSLSPARRPGVGAQRDREEAGSSGMQDWGAPSVVRVPQSQSENERENESVRKNESERESERESEGERDNERERAPATPERPPSPGARLDSPAHPPTPLSGGCDGRAAAVSVSPLAWDSQLVQNCRTQGFSVSSRGVSGGPTAELHPGSDPDLLPCLSPSWLTDSQLISLGMSEMALPPPEEQDATESVLGLITELSFLNRLVMSTHRELQCVKLTLRQQSLTPRAPGGRPPTPKI